MRHRRVHARIQAQFEHHERPLLDGPLHELTGHPHQGLAFFSI
jgi:hypothetical protein